jgi:hypothetical protein
MFSPRALDIGHERGGHALDRRAAIDEHRLNPAADSDFRIFGQCAFPRHALI